MYFRYVDDTFAIFNHEVVADQTQLPNSTSFILPLNLLSKKRKINVYRFLMSMSKEQIPALKPVYTGNLTKLNFLYPSLKFTFEKEKDKCLPFLNVHVERTDTGFETSVYRKPNFTGQYLGWESSPHKRKISLISLLVHRSLMICPKNRLNGKIERTKKILLDNDYSKNVVNAQIAKKIAYNLIIKEGKFLTFFPLLFPKSFQN